MTSRNRGRRSQRASSSRLPAEEDYDLPPSSSRTPLSISPSSSTESLLAKQQSRPRPLKIVIIGPESVGKTSLRQTYFTNRFQHNYKATIGADFEAKVLEHRPSGRKVLLSVWDTAGQERFRALGSAFYRGADAVLVCFDAADEDEKKVCEGIRGWVEEFREKSGVDAREFCWVAVGCKADTRGDGAIARKKIREVLDSLIERTGASAQGNVTSLAAATGLGDAPPAKPEEVLSRQGIHKEDDRELGLDGGGDEEQAASTPTPVPAGAPSSHATPNGSPHIPKRTGVGAATAGLPFPSSTPPKTPQKKTTPLPSARERERLDSTISMASSSQLSVYHTPRNSHFFGSTPTGGSKRVGGNALLTPSSSVGTIAGGATKGKPSHLQPSQSQQSHSSTVDDTTTSIATPRQAPAKPRPRALSAASEQSITSHAEPTTTTTRQPSSPTRGFSLYYTSALTGHNVQALFDHIVSRCHTKWTHDDYYSTIQLQGRRRLAEMEKRKLENRRSLWRSTLGRFGSTRGGAGGIEMDSGGADEEQNRIHNETRRMVRLSDGKADEAQGGCC